jgi:hypothetical protein
MTRSVAKRHFASNVAYQVPGVGAPSEMLCGTDEKRYIKTTWTFSLTLQVWSSYQIPLHGPPTQVNHSPGLPDRLPGKTDLHIRIPRSSQIMANTPPPFKLNGSPYVKLDEERIPQPVLPIARETNRTTRSGKSTFVRVPFGSIGAYRWWSRNPHSV